MGGRHKPSPRKSPAQERSRATVEHLLDAAAQVLERRGYAATSTNHIAERAGISVGSLYQYFPNKQAILVVLVERHMELGTRLFWDVLERSDPARDPLESLLRRFVEAMIELHVHRPALQRVLLEEAPRPPRVVAALRARKQRIIDAIAGMLRAHPEVRVRDPRAAAFLVAETVQALTHEYVVDAPADLDDRRFADELVAMLGRYLRG